VAELALDKTMIQDLLAGNKTVTPSRRRPVVQYLNATYQESERPASGVAREFRFVPIATSVFWSLGRSYLLCGRSRKRRFATVTVRSGSC
jgi:hypothetical protein